MAAKSWKSEFSRFLQRQTSENFDRKPNEFHRTVSLNKQNVSYKTKKVTFDVHVSIRQMAFLIFSTHCFDAFLPSQTLSWSIWPQSYLCFHSNPTMYSWLRRSDGLKPPEIFGAAWGSESRTPIHCTTMAVNPMNMMQ